MEQFSIVMGLIGSMFLAIIGVYIWTYKVYKDINESLGEVYNTVNSHLQNADIHTDKSEFVKSDVCFVIHEQLNADVQEIKQDVKILLSKR